MSREGQAEVKVAPVFPRTGTWHHYHRQPTGRIEIPARLGWWAQMQRERMCRRMDGHCFHSHLMTFWNCCMCGMSTEGMPQNRCHYCKEKP